MPKNDKIVLNLNKSNSAQKIQHLPLTILEDSNPSIFSYNMTPQKKLKIGRKNKGRNHGPKMSRNYHMYAIKSQEI